jgi:hypothetical protein
MGQKLGSNTKNKMYAGTEMYVDVHAWKLYDFAGL